MFRFVESAESVLFTFLTVESEHVKKNLHFFICFLFHASSSLYCYEHYNIITVIHY